MDEVDTEEEEITTELEEAIDTIKIIIIPTTTIIITIIITITNIIKITKMMNNITNNL